MKYRTIPIFIPEMACPCRCVYCNQFVISGQQQMPSDAEILSTIESHLATIWGNGVDSGEQRVEIGFFGGTFTGLPKEEQLRLLRLVSPYLETGKIKEIRCSTRPDRIEEPWLRELKKYGMQTIELGVQSMNDEVLKASGRGYSPATVEAAASAIRNAGMKLGMQMMIGLPGDTPQRSLETARRIVALGADNTRIYPTLVIEHTLLAERWRRGTYKALSIEEAVAWTKPVLKLMEESGLEVLRVGLHPTEGFINGTDYLAGPFHVAFKLQVQSGIWGDQFETLPGGERVTIRVAPQMLNAAAGYQGINRRKLEQRYRNVQFRPDEKLKLYEYEI